MPAKTSANCLILSTGRAASTAIYQYLDIAGAFNLPKQKEPHHWCDIPQYPGLYDLIWEVYTPDEQRYFNLYKGSKKIIDASCGYFFYLGDVIKNLNKNRQFKNSLKIIFLYREPISRALSWYNERKRKGLTKSEDVVADIMSVPKPGLWWEHYYDNVLYDRRFCQLQECFDEILAVNYDQFAKQPKVVIAELLSFLNRAPTGLEDLVCDPINSTQEALARAILSKHPYLQDIGRHLPPGIKSWLSRQLVHHRGAHLKKKQSGKYSRETDIASLLPVSVTEYRRFRERIGHQDLYVSR